MAAAMPAIYAAVVAVVAIAAAAAALAPSVLLPAHADGPEPGTLAFSFGSLGTADDEFDGARVLTIGPNGKIYVLDGGNRAVKVFHPNGTFDHVLPCGGGQHIVVGMDGVFYTVEPFYYVVTPCYLNGTLGSSVGGLYNILAVDRDGKFYGASRPQVHVYNPNGTLAFSFGSLGEDPGEFKSPNHITFGPDGKIYVSDGNYKIQAFHPNGTFAFVFRAGDWLSFGPSGEYFVNNVLYYPNGTTVGIYGLGVFGPTGMFAVANDNTVYVYHGIEPTDEWQPSSLYETPPDRGGGQGGGSGYMPPPAPSGPPVAGSRFAFEIGSYGSGPGEFRWPDNVAFGPGGIIAVSDWGNNRVSVFYPNGTFAYAFGSSGQGPGEFNRPFGIAFGPNGLLAVTDVGNHRVQFFYLE